ncbi:hypothetical protein JCM5350_007792 [Sporobolomyces pararoseus]
MGDDRQRPRANGCRRSWLLKLKRQPEIRGPSSSLKHAEEASQSEPHIQRLVVNPVATSASQAAPTRYEAPETLPDPGTSNGGTSNMAEEDRKLRFIEYDPVHREQLPSHLQARTPFFPPAPNPNVFYPTPQTISQFPGNFQQGVTAHNYPFQVECRQFGSPSASVLRQQPSHDLYPFPAAHSFQYRHFPPPSYPVLSQSYQESPNSFQFTSYPDPNSIPESAHSEPYYPTQYRQW